ncbi:hypothetical protein [uncultured Clostridium sp.]|uniref:hypothetical protein n=1 Tax=uncultured Clostridium sp. TaxID=59620 RepID=UPI0025DAE80D|nr:hypothetical protein [uncultured Clostridium sp.]
MTDESISSIPYIFITGFLRLSICQISRLKKGIKKSSIEFLIHKNTNRKPDLEHEPKTRPS